MNNENWQKLNELFAEASEMSPNERAKFAASVQNAEIRAELESLLSAHDASAEKFLNKNAVEISAQTLASENDSGKLIGRQIGQFKIIEEIGRGGMGAVFLAERTGADFAQKAALKLIKRGMDTDFIVQRFQTERRILSSLNHPFIAKLFDGGTTGDGLPYFAMEYVEGKNLKEFCREENPSLDKKLKIFRQICEAVSFAHRNLIVHRDLKPSNIIVCDDETPKLLDFGIAKALDADWENTERTTTEFRLLTPKYASPEQVRGELVGTQSDIYSLGILFREILETGAPNQKAKINRELEIIADKAAHEESPRRYASVEQFAEDIRRFQENLPILAQADSYGYRAKKFVERHRFGASAAALILLTLLAGIGATAWQFRRAQTEKKLAEQRFNDVRGLANSVIFELHDEIQNLPGSTKARKLLVEKALEYLNKLEHDAGSDANLQHEIAMAYLKIADVQGQVFEQSLLQTSEAEKNYRKALGILEKIVEAEPSNFEFRRDLALACYRFAEALRGSNNSIETLALEKRSAEIYEPLTKERPDDFDVRRRWLVARSGYADALRESGELEKSLPLYEQNLKDTQAAVQAAPDDVRLKRFLGIAYGGLSTARFQNDEAEKALDLILELRRIAPGVPSEENSYEFRNYAVWCEGVGRMAAFLGRNELAETNAREDIRIMEKIAKDDSENLEADYDVASAHNNYADFLEKNNRWQEAFEHRQKVLEAIVPLEKNEDNPELYTADFFEFYAKFARVAAKLKRLDLAGKYIEKAESLNFQIEKSTGEVQNLYALDFAHLGEAFQILGDREKAKTSYAKAVETWKKLSAEGKLYPNQKSNLAEIEQKLKSGSI
ncbi:MAG: serine/threonine-protein kinase [Pyrinomonadaceae bacterium]